MRIMTAHEWEGSIIETVEMAKKRSPRASGAPEDQFKQVFQALAQNGWLRI